MGLTLRNTGDLYFPSFLDQPARGSFLPEQGRLIAAIKDWVGADTVVVGGAGFSSNPERLLTRFGLKYGVVGPGESTIVEIADASDGGFRFSSRQLASAREGAGSCSRLDAPHAGCAGTADLRKQQKYYALSGLAGIRTSNGCGMRCSYCVEPFAKGDRYVRRAIENVVDEIDQLVEARIYDIHTCDSEFNMPLGFAKQVLGAIVERRYPRRLRLWAYCQPRPFDPEFADLLAAANCRGVNFGIDHTDATMLRRLGKTWYSQKDISDSARFCRERGIAVNHECLFGYPGDTPSRCSRR